MGEPPNGPQDLAPDGQETSPDVKGDLAAGGGPGGGAATPAVEHQTRGAFVVASREREDGLKDLLFILRLAQVPHDQLTLKSDVERTQSALLVLYSRDLNKFSEAFAKLLSLTQVGLVGDKASPTVAREALNSLQREILDREGGQVKNGYLRKLGGWAAGLFALLFTLYWISTFAPIGVDPANAALCLLVSGSPIGAWLSFASRKVQMTFFDLSQIEDDRLDPSIRLIFVALLTLTFALLLVSGALNIEVGSFSAKNFLKDPYTALLLGILLGLAEKALPARILDQANAFLAKSV